MLDGNQTLDAIKDLAAKGHNPRIIFAMAAVYILMHQTGNETPENTLKPLLNTVIQQWLLRLNRNKVL